MSRAVVWRPLRPRSANGSARGPSPLKPRCSASAVRATSDAEQCRRRASRSSALASSSVRDIVVRFIRTYYHKSSTEGLYWPMS